MHGNLEFPQNNINSNHFGFGDMILSSIQEVEMRNQTQVHAPYTYLCRSGKQAPIDLFLLVLINEGEVISFPNEENEQGIEYRDNECIIDVIVFEGGAVVDDPEQIEKVHYWQLPLRKIPAHGASDSKIVVRVKKISAEGTIVSIKETVKFIGNADEVAEEDIQESKNRKIAENCPYTYIESKALTEAMVAELPAKLQELDVTLELSDDNLDRLSAMIAGGVHLLSPYVIVPTFGSLYKSSKLSLAPIEIGYCSNLVILYQPAAEDASDGDNAGDTPEDEVEVPDPVFISDLKINQLVYFRAAGQKTRFCCSVYVADTEEEADAITQASPIKLYFALVNSKLPFIDSISALQIKKKKKKMTVSDMG